MASLAIQLKTLQERNAEVKRAINTKLFEFECGCGIEIEYADGHSEICNSIKQCETCEMIISILKELLQKLGLEK